MLRLKYLVLLIIGFSSTIAVAGNPSRPTRANPLGGLPPDVAAALEMQALQSRRHRGVQTGVANPIIMAGPQMEPFYDPLPPTTGNGKSKAKSSYEKRLEARQVKEENKRLARERAEKLAAEKKAAKERKAVLARAGVKDRDSDVTNE